MWFPPHAFDATILAETRRIAHIARVTGEARGVRLAIHALATLTLLVPEY